MGPAAGDGMDETLTRDSTAVLPCSHSEDEDQDEDEDKEEDISSHLEKAFPERLVVFLLDDVHLDAARENFPRALLLGVILTDTTSVPAAQTAAAAAAASLYTRGPGSEDEHAHRGSGIVEKRCAASPPRVRVKEILS